LFTINIINFLHGIGKEKMLGATKRHSHYNNLLAKQAGLSPQITIRKKE